MPCCIQNRWPEQKCRAGSTPSTKECGASHAERAADAGAVPLQRSDSSSLVESSGRPRSVRALWLPSNRQPSRQPGEMLKALAVWQPIMPRPSAPARSTARLCVFLIECHIKWFSASWSSMSCSLGRLRSSSHAAATAIAARVELKKSIPVLKAAWPSALPALCAHRFSPTRRSMEWLLLALQFEHPPCAGHRSEARVKRSRLRGGEQDGSRLALNSVRGATTDCGGEHLKGPRPHPL
eukprot:4788392-Prymnesium_polylepis.1